MSQQDEHNTERSALSMKKYFVVAALFFLLPIQAGAQTDAIEEEEFQTGKCLGIDTTHQGSVDGDHIVGTPNGDVMQGGPGADLIEGRGGRDTICGGKGADFLEGESAGDIIHGGNGNDDLFGNDGNDRLDGADGWDRGWGGPGDDDCARLERQFSC